MIKSKVTALLMGAAVLFLGWGQNCFSEGEEASIQGRALAVVEYNSDLLRDPFLNPLIRIEKPAEEGSAAEGEAAAPTLVVQGIIWGGMFPLGIINGQVVKEGDNIEGAQIQKITKDGITASYGGAPFNLSAPYEAGPSQKSEEGI